MKHCMRPVTFLIIFMLMMSTPNAGWGATLLSDLWQSFKGELSVRTNRLASVGIVNALIGIGEFLLLRKLGIHQFALFEQGMKSGGAFYHLPKKVGARDGIIAEATIPERVRQFIPNIEQSINNCRAIKGLLLKGPVGTGKTQLGYYIAKKLGCFLIYETSAGLVGEREDAGCEAVDDLFKRARKRPWIHYICRLLSWLPFCKPVMHKPTIMLLDEVDAILRADADKKYESTRLQLLSAMWKAQRDIVVIATTNASPNVLFPNYQYYFSLVEIEPLSAEGRLAVMQAHASHYQLSPEVNLQQLVDGQTDGMSGAELAHLFNDATIMAAGGGRTEITQEDLMRALDARLRDKQR